MNRETGAIYRGELDILNAQLRGEPVVPVSERVAQAVEIGLATMNQHERRRQEKLDRKGAKPQRKRRH